MLKLCIWGAPIYLENKYEPEQGTICQWTEHTLPTTDPEKFLNIFLLFTFFFLLYFTLQYCIGFAIHRHESTTGVHAFPNMNSPPTSHRISSLRAPAPSILYLASNIDWRFISYMVVYMFQCHSPKSSHPLPLPQSPKVHSKHLCLFCCLTYRVIITIFLNSIYMC